MTKSEEGANLTVTYLSDTPDIVTPAPVPPRSANWTFEASPELPVNSNGRILGFNVSAPLVPDVTFAEALRNLDELGKVRVMNAYGEMEERSVDVLFIPGGIGTRLQRVEAGTGQRSSNVAAAQDFLSKVIRHGWVQTAIMTVCTGSDLLARTGVLDGRRAVTNYRAFAKVAERNKGVNWLPKRRWARSLPSEIDVKKDQGESEDSVSGDKVVSDKEIWTSAGISAGIDLMLWFVAEVYGKKYAQGIARRLEYEWRENIGDGEHDPYYDQESDV